MEQTDISIILGGRKVLQGGIASRMELIKLSNKGVSKEVLLNPLHSDMKHVDFRNVEPYEMDQLLLR